MLGILLLVVGAVAPYAGLPGNCFILAIVAGGGFLVASGYVASRIRRLEV